jgi:hypothetical protein
MSVGWVERSETHPYQATMHPFLLTTDLMLICI